MTHFRRFVGSLLIALVWGCASTKLVSTLDAPEVMGWGTLNGIRVAGQLMEFTTSLRIMHADGVTFSETGRDRRGQRLRYERNGNIQTISVSWGPLSYKEIVTASAPGVAAIALQCSSKVDTSITGAYFSIRLPGADFFGGSVQLGGPTSGGTAIPLAATASDSLPTYVRTTAGGARFLAPQRALDIRFASPTEIIVREDSSGGEKNVLVLLELISGSVHKGLIAQNIFTLKAGGAVDRAAATLVMDASRPGQVFDGIGGNFRLQNPKTDPPVIDYNLKNLRVTWGRVEMPWQFWQPDANVDPVARAQTDSLHPFVRASMAMAQRLAQKGMPVIVSVWYPPAWAVIGDPREAFRPRPGGLRGNPLNPEKLAKIYASIGGYLLYLKQHYGVEAVAFSFNESDLGINVRQTAEEHAELIKGLGAYLASIGLATKLLLGDTADASPIDFIKPAMADPEAVQYLAAVSFHSWRGCTDQNLAYWRDAARQLNLPLLVGEGSTDAGAWTYPQIFDESSFALSEINLYTRICAISQPKSILQWQLTADYSLLVGGGIFSNPEKLRPTQRFWNLKQLGVTPVGAFALPITCDNPSLTSAAFGDIARGIYAVHIVNNGASRPVTLTGLPDSVRQLRIYVTDSERGMQEGKRIPVVSGKAQFTLDALGFTTLISTP